VDHAASQERFVGRTRTGAEVCRKGIRWRDAATISVALPVRDTRRARRIGFDCEIPAKGLLVRDDLRRVGVVPAGRR
jgi:hypothetical protein